MDNNQLNLGGLRLQWKVFAFLLGFCGLLLIILWLFQTVFLDDVYKIIRRQELRRAITLVEKEIDSPNLQTVLIKIQEENDILVALTQDFVPPQRQGPNLQIVQGNTVYETITEVREFSLKNGQTISLTFYALIAPVNATVTTLRYQLYFISGIMLVLAIILAMIIAKRVSRPIEAISQSAQALAKGNYDMRFNGKGFNEVVVLSDTLNTAAIELGRVENLRRELLANVSHDLRTPIALIYSYAEMMSDFPSEITPEQTQVIMDETQRLTTLVNDVLEISKLENEMGKINRSYFNLTQNIAETVERLGKLLKQENFEISFSYDSTALVNADKIKIDRAFYNLLINAVNYSGESRHISVSQTITDNGVRIGVTDSGEGIAEDDLPFIWDRYYKSGKAHKRAITGTGLGLSIIKKIIELHGGRYGVVSEIGKGSTFWFELELPGPLS